MPESIGVSLNVKHIMKPGSEARMIEQAKQALLRCLQGVPFLNVEVACDVPFGTTADVDFVVQVKTPRLPHVLIVDVKPNGQPRLARNAVDRLFRHTSLLPGSYGVFMAPYISPRSAAICIEAGFGYADLAGNCRLTFDHVYINVEGHENPFAQKRDLRSLYSPRAERVLRTLFRFPGRNWRLQELAAEANVSLGQVHNVKSLLDDREWMQGTHRTGGFALIEPNALLDEWARVYETRQQQHESYFSLRELPDLETGIAEACKAAGTKYALTGLSAAARVAPFVRYQRADVYINGPLHPVIEALALKSVPSGANVHIRVPYDEGILYGAREKDGIVIVSPLQNYLDLRAEGGRARDGAEFLRERIIAPEWKAAT